uniref:Uncharacterized protein n=1 Tax=Phenylobacterium glaciei TaxID=2803784 RepID=A0A974P1I1_9CAUL|nr:hypothetical protein JKL49_14320 [Phenylobacterium glaciei]
MIRILLTAAALLAAGSAQAQAPGQPKPAGTRYVDYAKDPHWVVDPLSKCAVYNTRPDPAITVRWAGPCVNGMAEGKGIIVYSRNNRFAAKYDGGVSGGRATGAGSTTRPISTSCRSTGRTAWPRGWASGPMATSRT